LNPYDYPLFVDLDLELAVIVHQTSHLLANSRPQKPEMDSAPLYHLLQTFADQIAPQHPFLVEHLTKYPKPGLNSTANLKPPYLNPYSSQDLHQKLHQQVYSAEQKRNLDFPPTLIS
jgi:hypothetical protein